MLRQDYIRISQGISHLVDANKAKVMELVAMTVGNSKAATTITQLALATSRKRPRLLRESRVVSHLAIEAEPAAPAVSKVHVRLLAQAPLGTNTVAVAGQQHPHEQFGIN